MNHLALLLGLLLQPTAPATPVTSAPPVVPAVSAAPVPSDDAQPLPRAEFEAVLSHGAQGLIAATRFAPSVRGGRFVGWRILGFVPTGPLANGRALQPEDVLVRVNGEPLERPEQAMRAWETVRRAERVDLAVLRNDVPMTLRWRIVP